MQPQVGSCYYHPEKGAVAICSSCGVGICRDCLVRDDRGRILCRDCGNEYLRQEHKEYRKRLKESGGRFQKGTEFIVPSVVGVLIVAAAGLLLHYGVFDTQFHANEMAGNWGLFILVAYMLFSIPFCYIGLSDLIAPKFESSTERWQKRFEKFIISLLFGWAVFTFIVIRFFVRKSRAGRSKGDKT